MANLFFVNGNIKTPSHRYHTPTTFRAQKRLRFTNPTPLIAPTIPHPPPPGVSPPRPQAINTPTTNKDPFEANLPPRIPTPIVQPEYENIISMCLL